MAAFHHPHSQVLSNPLCRTSHLRHFHLSLMLGISAEFTFQKVSWQAGGQGGPETLT